MNFSIICSIMPQSPPQAGGAGKTISFNFCRRQKLKEIVFPVSAGANLLLDKGQFLKELF